MKRLTAIYVRVSSKAQDLAAQIPDLEAWAKAQPAGSCMRFTDHLSGRTMDRPGFNEMMESARAGTIGRVVVWRLDRLGRTARGLTALFQELQELGVNLVSLKDGLDLATPAGRLMAHVLASVAEYETEVRGERVKAGIAAARAKGKRWGGSAKGRRLKVTPHIVREVWRYRGRMPVKAIARAVGVSRGTVYQILRDPPPKQRTQKAPRPYAEHSKGAQDEGHQDSVRGVRRVGGDPDGDRRDGRKQLKGATAAGGKSSRAAGAAAAPVPRNTYDNAGRRGHALQRRAEHGGARAARQRRATG